MIGCIFRKNGRSTIPMICNNILITYQVNNKKTQIILIKTNKSQEILKIYENMQ